MVTLGYSTSSHSPQILIHPGRAGRKVASAVLATFTLSIFVAENRCVIKSHYDFLPESSCSFLEEAQPNHDHEPRLFEVSGALTTTPILGVSAVVLVGALELLRNWAIAARSSASAISAPLSLSSNSAFSFSFFR